MKANLLKKTWTFLDAAEFRLLLDSFIGGPGQYSGRSENPDKFYLPLAGDNCRVVLTFRQKRIVAIEPGPAFDAAEWERVRAEIETSIVATPTKVGRDYSFSSLRVPGSWRGERSGVQILPPPDDAPRAPVEMAEHPFILEFPIKPSDQSSIVNYRRTRHHRRLTLLLNVLLAGRSSVQARQP
ncbi:MAG TPA: hypothetical protein VGM03_03350, partial [Phycisphaerae bacterium]